MWSGHLANVERAGRQRPVPIPRGPGHAPDPAKALARRRSRGVYRPKLGGDTRMMELLLTVIVCTMTAKLIHWAALDPDVIHEAGYQAIALMALGVLLLLGISLWSGRRSSPTPPGRLAAQAESGG